jgi:hypothetical protein
MNKDAEVASGDFSPTVFCPQMACKMKNNNDWISVKLVTPKDKTCHDTQP